MALIRETPRYAYELIEALGKTGLLTTEGTLYPLLSRLRRDGLVKTEWQESTDGPPRRYYHLTSDGELALASFTKQWRVFRDAVDEILSEGTQE